MSHRCLIDSLNVKNYREWQTANESSQTFIVIDCIQIVSLTNRFKNIIGNKYVAKGSDVRKAVKWNTIEIYDQKKESFSDNYYVAKKECVHCDGRRFLARIGTQVSAKESQLIEVNVLLNTLSEREVDSIYNGSHLESVVLYKSTIFGLTLLSFEKTLRPVPRDIIASDFKQYLMQFPDEVQELYHGIHAFPLLSPLLI